MSSNAPERVKTTIQAAEAAGSNTIGFYLTMGEYDYIAITEAPIDEAAIAITSGYLFL